MPVASSAASDPELERVVAEEAQVAGAGSGRDPGQYRNARAAGSAGGEPVQIRGRGRLQFGSAPRLERQATEPVGDQHHDLGIRFFSQFPDEFELIHGSTFLGREEGGLIRSLAEVVFAAWIDRCKWNSSNAPGGGRLG